MEIVVKKICLVGVKRGMNMKLKLENRFYIHGERKEKESGKKVTGFELSIYWNIFKRFLDN